MPSTSIKGMVATKDLAHSMQNFLERIHNQKVQKMTNWHKHLCRLLHHDIPFLYINKSEYSTKKKKKRKAKCVTNVKLVAMDYYLSLCGRRSVVADVLSRGQATTSELKNSSLLLFIKK